jgi:hypothetical protein
MAWTSPATWTAALVTVSQFNQQIRDNLNALKSPPVAVAEPASNYTITTTGFADVDTDDFKCEVTLAGTVALVWFNGTVQHSDTGGTVNFNVSIDNVDAVANDGIICVRPMDFSTSHRMPVSFVYRITGITPGTRTFRLRWKTSGATATLLANGGSGNAGDVHTQFGVVELT